MASALSRVHEKLLAQLFCRVSGLLCINHDIDSMGGSYLLRCASARGHREGEGGLKCGNWRGKEPSPLLLLQAQLQLSNSWNACGLLIKTWWGPPWAASQENIQAHRAARLESFIPSFLPPCFLKEKKNPEGTGSPRMAEREGNKINWMLQLQQILRSGPGEGRREGPGIAEEGLFHGIPISQPHFCFLK